MTTEWLEKLEKLVSKASPGPWQLTESKDDYIRAVDDVTIATCWLGNPHKIPDSQFITASRTELPRLLRVVRELKKELKRELTSFINPPMLLEDADRYIEIIFEQILNEEEK